MLEQVRLGYLFFKIELKNLLQGCKIKMDDSGNILVKRIAKSNVYVKNTTEENSISNDILKVRLG
jgi:hypothetical protein